MLARALTLSGLDSTDRRDPLFPLPRTLDVGSVTEGCRDALLQFVEEASSWSKRDLAIWLSGPYRTLTGHAASSHKSRHMVITEPVSPVDPERVVAVMRDARIYALKLLRTSRPAILSLIARSAAANGVILACVDHRGEVGWIPVSTPRMTLRMRLVSLWTVDYLARTSDYESAVCPCGRHMEFDACTRLRGGCEERTSSGIRVRWDARAEGAYRSSAPRAAR